MKGTRTNIVPKPNSNQIWKMVHTSNISMVVDDMKIGMVVDDMKLITNAMWNLP